MDFERTRTDPELEAVKAMIALRLAVLKHLVKTLPDGLCVPYTIKSDTSSKSVFHEPDAPVFVKQNS